MTDVHTHVSSGDSSVREIVTGVHFFGTHPHCASAYDEGELEGILERNTAAGVGEIGLDRTDRDGSGALELEVFRSQLRLASRYARPVTLHGVKCWGKVVRIVLETLDGMVMPPSFLFHGFSRSWGLLPEIAAMNGFISVGPQILNDHAVNYRKAVARIPPGMLLVETDTTAGNAASRPALRQVLEALAAVRGVSAGELEELTDRNAERFYLPG